MVPQTCEVGLEDNNLDTTSDKRKRGNVGMAVTSTQLYARSYMNKGQDRQDGHARKSEEHVR